MRSCDVHLNDWCADVVVAIIAVVVIAVVDIAVVFDIANPSRRRVLRVRYDTIRRWTSPCHRTKASARESGGARVHTSIKAVVQ